MLQGLITITGIPVGQQVLLSNINMHHSAFVSLPPNGLRILNCAGDVLIEDFLFMNAGDPGQVLRIEDSANVVLRGCEFRIGGAPIEIIDSTVLLTTTAVYHVPPQPFTGYTQTAEALNLTNSTVTVIGSLVRGSDEWAPWPSTLLRQPGVVMHGSMLRVGPASLVSGGARQGSTPGTYTYHLGYYAPIPATSGVQVDARATVRTIPISGPPPVPTNIHAVYHAWVVADEPFDISVAGPSNGFALLILGDMTPFPAAMPWGTLAVDPLTVILVDLVSLPPPYGTLEWTFHCPGTAPNAHAFAFQALTLSPSGQLGLTVPSPLTVGWEHGRIP